MPAPLLLEALDLAIIVSASVSTYLWWRATSMKLRHVRKDEEIDHLDLNRLIVAFRRNNVLNARAALATGCATLFTALKQAAELLA